MALDWLPTYPTVLVPTGGLGAQFGPPYAANAFPAIPGWRPTYPDRVIRATFAAHLQLAFATGLKPIPTFPPTPLAWKPHHPDQVWRTPFLPSSQPTLRLELQPVLPVPALSWKAQYPDQLLLPKRSVLTVGEPIFTAGIRIAPYESWTPIYPSRIDRRVLPSADHWTVSLVTPSTFPIPVLGWQGVYPSQIAPRVSLGTPSQTVFAINWPPIKNPPPNQAGLIPTYPDRIVPQTSLSAGGQREFQINWSPIPNPPAPTFSWQAIGPDRVLGPVRVPASFVIYPFTVQSVTPFTWMAQGPDPTRRPPPTPDNVPFTPSHSLVPLPTTVQWAASYPDTLRLPVRVVEGFSALLVIPALRHDPNCIELTKHALGVADLVGQTAGTPELTGSTLGVADLVNETIC